MSHQTGKIEVVGLTDSQVIFKYHRAAHPENLGRVMIFNRNPEAHWFDDYPEAQDFEQSLPSRARLHSIRRWTPC
jgi:hypothetical protein